MTSLDQPPVLDTETVACIYAGAFSDPPWRAAVERICDRLDALMAALSFRTLSEGMPTIGVQAFRGCGRRIWDRFHADHSDVVTFDYDRLEPGRIYEMDNSVQPGGQRLRDELLIPSGAGACYCLPLGDCREDTAYLVWLKPLGRPITGHERDWCLAMAPHLTRAVSGYYRTRRAELSSSLAADALSRLSIGVAALDRAGLIMFSNGVAERIINASPDLGIRGGRLVAARPELRQKLAAGRFNTQVSRLRDERSESIGVLITPVGRRDELGPGSRPELAIYFHELSAPAAIPERLVAELYRLSAVEAKLAVLLAEGVTLREIGPQLGITENTARTYSKKIFAKLGVSRQVDLVRALLRSVAMLGPDDHVDAL